MGRVLLFAMVFAYGMLARADAAPWHTPKPGSPERVAICDSLRTYMAAEWVQGKLPGKMVFKIDWLRVAGDFAFIDCRPGLEDGREIPSEILPPVDYLFLLQSVSGKWRVIQDFSGSDLPEPSWWANVKKRLPPAVPADIFPEYPRRNLGL